MAQNPGYHIERISESIVSTKFEDIDKVTLRLAKLRVLDVLGCTMLGATCSGGAELADLAKSWGGKEESTLFVFGGKVPAQTAAMVNSAVTRIVDYEAIGALVEGVDLPSHISSTTVITAIAMAESQNARGKDLLTGLLVGDDIAARILYASGVQDGKNFEWGWDGNGTVNAFGAAAIAGYMLKLSKKQMQNAFGIVLNQLSGTFQNLWDFSMAFALTSAFSARNGICSAELAKAGWDGPNDPLFSRYGYFFLFTDGCSDEEILTKDIGKKFYTEATFKPYPSCRSTHYAVDCAMKFVSEHDIDANSIEEVIIKLPPGLKNFFTAQPFALRENPQVDMANSITFGVANVLLRKEAKFEHYRKEFAGEAAIADITGKSTIVDLDPDELEQRHAQIKVKLKDGREYSSEVQSARGDYYNGSFTEEDVKEKFRYNVQYSKRISKDSGEKIIELVDNLDELDDISELTKLMV